METRNWRFPLYDEWQVIFLVIKVEGKISWHSERKKGHLGVSSIDRGHSEISPLDSGETPKYLPEIEG